MDENGVEQLFGFFGDGWEFFIEKMTCDFLSILF